MILGIGNDLTGIERIERLLARFGARFEERVFTSQERVRARNSVRPAAAYAKRFAAKEACAKALGSGIAGISWLDIEVANLPSGAPCLLLHGAALGKLAALTPSGMSARLHLSLCDEGAFAQAFVIAEAL